jgi:hypothetical protein
VVRALSKDSKAHEVRIRARPQGETSLAANHPAPGSAAMHVRMVTAIRTTTSASCGESTRSVSARPRICGECSATPV